MTFRWAKRFIFVAGLLGLLASACTSAEPTATLRPPPPTPIPTATPVPAPTATPVVAPGPQGSHGGSLTVAGAAAIPHRDVHQSVQETLTTLGPGLAYSRLLRLRSGEDFEQPHLLLECDLCESWELNKDMVFEFRLRPDVYWQDLAPVHGRPLVAEDLVFSYERLRTPGWPNAALLSSFGVIQATGDRTLSLELAVTDADALLSLADGHSKIVAPEVVAEYGDLKDSPVVGTGPWVWQETAPAAGPVLLRNTDYFEPGLPFLDELRIAVFQNGGPLREGGQPVAAAYVAGLVDVASVFPGEWEPIDRVGRPFQSTVSRQLGQGIVLALNTATSPLQDQAVRQAVFQAIDPWDYLDTVWPDQGFASVGIPVFRADWLLNRSDMRQDYFADPVRGRELLAESGLDLPLDIEVALHAALAVDGWGPQDRLLAQKLEHDLLDVGFNPTIRLMNPEQFDELVVGPNREFQLAVGPMPPTSTPNRFLFGLLHSDGRWNIAQHQDTGLNALIEQQAGEFDANLRQRRLEEIQRHVLDQAYLFSPVTASFRWVYTDDLRGFAPNTALSEYNYWSRVWLDR